MWQHDVLGPCAAQLSSQAPLQQYLQGLCLLACIHNSLVMTAQIVYHYFCASRMHLLRHTLGVPYPDRCLHAVPAAPNFCTSGCFSRSNHVYPASTVCKGACKRAQHYFDRNLRHMGQTPPFKWPAIFQDLAVETGTKSRTKLLGQSSMNHDSQVRGTMPLARCLFLARSYIFKAFVTSKTADRQLRHRLWLICSLLSSGMLVHKWL